MIILVTLQSILGFTAFFSIGYICSELFFPEIKGIERIVAATVSALIFLPAALVLASVYLDFPITKISVVKVVFVVTIILVLSRELLYRITKREDS